MGQNAAETVNEISELREGLEEKVEDLEQRLPVIVVWTKRAAGLALGGGVTGGAFWLIARRARRRRIGAGGGPTPDAVTTGENRQSPAVADLFGADLASAVSDGLKGGRWKPWAVGILAVWSAVRLAELRQLRRTNRMLIASRP